MATLTRTVPAKTAAIKSLKSVKCSRIKGIYWKLTICTTIPNRNFSYCYPSAWTPRILFSDSCISVFQASFVLLFKLVQHYTQRKREWCWIFALDCFVTLLLISRFASFVASGQHILEEEMKIYDYDPTPWLTSDSDGNDSDPNNDL